jgi:DNA-binding MarR family transcriptional regulator
MGETALNRGLFPDDRLAAGATSDLQLDLLWAGMRFHVHRMGQTPIAQALVAWTNVILLHRGYHPTIMDLARATGLPRSTVSRYIDAIIRDGIVEERVNPKDRRRRELYLTRKGAEELAHIAEAFQSVFSYVLDLHETKGSGDSGAEVLSRMTELTKRVNDEML